MLRQWNATYDAIDHYILPPFCPHEEKETQEEILAMIHIYKEACMISKMSLYRYELTFNSLVRKVFQYGDIGTKQIILPFNIDTDDLFS